MSKKVNASVIDAKKNEIANVNLSKFAKELESKNVSHSRNERETIYIYPASIPKERINEKEGKQFRGKMRSSLQRFCNNVFYYGKMEDHKLIKEEIEKFDAFYKENYRINDFSLKSLSSSNDPARNKDIDLFLQIVKEFKSI